MPDKLDFIGPGYKKKLKSLLKNIDESINVLYEIATHDEKTGLYNYKFLKTSLEIELAQSKRTKSLSLAIIDIDFFKKINDTSGHLFGDKILKQLATLLQQQTRKSDILARFGGEEFVIILPSTSLEKAKKVAERIRKKVAKDSFLKKYNVTISIGLTQSNKTDTYSRIIKRADKALYKAKQKGRNRIEIKN